jgi:hypothetical protein
MIVTKAKNSYFVFSIAECQLIFLLPKYYTKFAIFLLPAPHLNTFVTMRLYLIIGRGKLSFSNKMGVAKMAIWKEKGCPECGADLMVQLETNGWYEECLWCGYHRDVSNLVTLSTGEQFKINGKIATNQKLFTDVHVTLSN